MKGNGFFIPWVPENYRKGINGKQIFVVGASYFCDKYQCPFFQKCTDSKKKDSSDFDSTCPYAYANGKHYMLHNEPDYSTGEHEDYDNFAELFDPYVPSNIDIWDYVAYTNYVQYFKSGHDRKTYDRDVTETDFLHLKKFLLKYPPKILITWGSVVQRDLIKKLKDYIIDLHEFDETGGYIQHFRLPEMDYDIAWLAVYHPSYLPNWRPALQTAQKYLGDLLNE